MIQGLEGDTGLDGRIEFALMSINKPPPFKGLKIRIPIIVPMKGRRFINQGPGLSLVNAAVCGALQRKLPQGRSPSRALSLASFLGRGQA